MNEIEIYYYLYDSMKNYLYSPGFDINYNIIEEYLKERLSSDMQACRQLR